MRRLPPDRLLPRLMPITGEKPFVHARMIEPVPSRPATALAVTGSYCAAKASGVVLMTQLLLTLALTVIAGFCAAANDGSRTTPTSAPSAIVRFITRVLFE